MLYVTLPSRETLPATDFASAQFWEAGAHRGLGPIGEVGEVDELVVEMKDRAHQLDCIVGQDAREYAHCFRIGRRASLLAVQTNVGVTSFLLLGLRVPIWYGPSH
jgi:hypothetical protein